MLLLIKSSFTTNLIRSAIQSRTLCNCSLLRSNRVPEEVIPKNLLEEYFSHHKQGNGEIYDNKPFKMTLKAGKTYAWCNCGQSKSQPLCDGTHKIIDLKITLRPVFFKVAESKEYWLCNCKHTLHKPFCDGTHKNEEIVSSKNKRCPNK